MAYTAEQQTKIDEWVNRQVSGGAYQNLSSAERTKIGAQVLGFEPIATNIVAGESASRVQEEAQNLIAGGADPNLLTQSVAPIVQPDGTIGAPQQPVAGGELGQITLKDFELIPGEDFDTYMARIDRIRQMALDAGQTLPTAPPPSSAASSPIESGDMEDGGESPFISDSEEPVDTDATTPPGISGLGLSQAEKDIQGDISDIQSLTKGLAGEAEFRSQQEEKFGIEGLTKTQKDLETRLQDIKNRSAAVIPQTEEGAVGMGITTELLGRKQKGLLRQLAIESLQVSSLLEASRGNLTLAQDQVDRAVAKKYDPIREKIAIAQDNLQLALKDPALTLAEQNRAAKLELFLSKQKGAIDMQEYGEKQLWELTLKAAENGASADILSKMQKAGSKEEALQIGGEFLADEDGGGGGLFGDPGLSEGEVLTNLQAVGIPVGVASSSGVLKDSMRNKLIDKQFPLETIDDIWFNIVNGLTFEEIRQGIREGGADPAILDTFVMTLQGIDDEEGGFGDGTTQVGDFDVDFSGFGGTSSFGGSTTSGV